MALVHIGEVLMRSVAVYPGSFDPVTNGHLDIIGRCRTIFSEVIVAILSNPRKEPLFTTDERREMLQAVLGESDGVRVVSFDGLLVRFARQENAKVIVRGLRAVSDFEYEFQMALMNRKLDDGIETLFMAPHESHTYLSSSLIKEIYGLGGSVDELVPAPVKAALKTKIALADHNIGEVNERRP